jgi:hypothetical protein
VVFLSGTQVLLLGLIIRAVGLRGLQHRVDDDRNDAVSDIALSS